MAKTVNLTPRLRGLMPADQELMIPYTAGERPMGESVGGLQMYSNAFKRGYGDKVFGSDENGIWLGAADFGDAPFSVDMEGNVVATTLSLSGYLTKADTSQNLTGSINVGGGNVVVDGVNKRILINDGTNNRVLLGFQSGGF